MLKIGSVRWRGKCPRHPRFDPCTDGGEAINEGCPKCTALADIHSLHVQMLARMRVFTPREKARDRGQKETAIQTNLFGEL